MLLNKQQLEKLLSCPVDSRMTDFIIGNLRDLFPSKNEGDYTADEIKDRLQEVITIMEGFIGDIEVDDIGSTLHLYNPQKYPLHRIKDVDIITDTDFIDYTSIQQKELSIIYDILYNVHKEKPVENVVYSYYKQIKSPINAKITLNKWHRTLQNVLAKLEEIQKKLSPYRVYVVIPFINDYILYNKTAKSLQTHNFIHDISEKERHKQINTKLPDGTNITLRESFKLSSFNYSCSRVIECLRTAIDAVEILQQSPDANIEEDIFGTSHIANIETIFSGWKEILEANGNNQLSQVIQKETDRRLQLQKAGFMDSDIHKDYLEFFVSPSHFAIKRNLDSNDGSFVKDVPNVEMTGVVLCLLEHCHVDQKMIEIIIHYLVDKIPMGRHWNHRHKSTSYTYLHNRFSRIFNKERNKSIQRILDEYEIKFNVQKYYDALPR